MRNVLEVNGFCVCVCVCVCIPRFAATHVLLAITPSGLNWCTCVPPLKAPGVKGGSKLRASKLRASGVLFLRILGPTFFVCNSDDTSTTTPLRCVGEYVHVSDGFSGP